MSTTQRHDRGDPGRRRWSARWLVLAVLPLAGCPGPDPSGPCGNEDGDPVLELANRGDRTAITDGSLVYVFPPPQGGTFTELDVTIDGLDADDLDQLVVTFISSDTGKVYTHVTYVGGAIPLRCTEDDVLEVKAMPVGFFDSFEILDGQATTLTGTLVTARGDFTVTHEVVLRATEY
jgi:hypothetical protein